MSRSLEELYSTSPLLPDSPPNHNLVLLRVDENPQLTTFTLCSIEIDRNTIHTESFWGDSVCRLRVSTKEPSGQGLGLRIFNNTLTNDEQLERLIHCTLNTHHNHMKNNSWISKSIFIQMHDLVLCWNSVVYSSQDSFVLRGQTTIWRSSEFQWFIHRYITGEFTVETFCSIVNHATTQRPWRLSPKLLHILSNPETVTKYLVAAIM